MTLFQCLSFRRIIIAHVNRDLLGYIKEYRFSNARVPSRVTQNAYSIGKTFHFRDKRRSTSIPGETRISIRF